MKCIYLLRAGRPHISFIVLKDRTSLLSLLPEILKIADSEKDALGFWPEQQLREAIERGRLWAVTLNDVLQGYLIYSGIFPNAKIQQVATSPSARGSGVATLLLHSLKSELEKLDFLIIRADIASDLSGALAFYAKQGFVPSYTRPGGKTRNRRIIVHIYELDTETLFTLSDRNRSDFNFEFVKRSAGDASLFAFDLNVYFDLVKNRAQSANAGKIFSAALSHQIRLVVAKEFAIELERTSNNVDTDPILQLALRLPKLPNANKIELEKLASRIHNIVFSQAQQRVANSTQAISDSNHLAHAALARASAFVTRDKALLTAREQLLSHVGIDVVDLYELIELLPIEIETRRSINIGGMGDDFSTLHVNSEEAQDYLVQAKVSSKIIQEFCQVNPINNDSMYVSANKNSETVAVGIFCVPKTIGSVVRILVHSLPENPNSELFSECLLNILVRISCSGSTTAMELVHIPGQSSLRQIAKSFGFLRQKASLDYSKVALDRPLTSTNWSDIVDSIWRRTGLKISNTAPENLNKTIDVVNPMGVEFSIKPLELEVLLSPSLIICAGRDGAVVSIRRNYADELLGTSRQSRFDFIENKKAAFLSRRCFVNSPRFAKILRPGRLIMFYESLSQGGRGAIVAIARIVDVVVVDKYDAPDSEVQRSVVDKVQDFSSSGDVLLTTFDNILEVPNPIYLGALRDLRIADGANLVAPVKVSSDQVINMIKLGWPDEK